MIIKAPLHLLPLCASLFLQPRRVTHTCFHQPDALTLAQFHLGCVPDLLLKCLSDQIYITKRMK